MFQSPLSQINYCELFLYCVRGSHIYCAGGAGWFGAGASRSAGVGSAAVGDVTGRSVIFI